MRHRCLIEPDQSCVISAVAPQEVDVLTRDQGLRAGDVRLVRPWVPFVNTGGWAGGTTMGIHKVAAKGSGGTSATVVVLAQQGDVWLSIDPPLTWEAIMTPSKVDEVIRILGLARDDAKRMRAAGPSPRSR